MATQINNEVYNHLGRRWLEADDDPVALLRALSRLLAPWLSREIAAQLPQAPKQNLKVLDIGCGAGLTTNRLAEAGFRMTGLDQSDPSLQIARGGDSTGAVRYLTGNAYQLPFPEESFDAVMAMDFLEHVEDPAAVIAEAARVLKPGGRFYFHTFNKNPLSWLVAIKAVEWLIKNTPRHLHVYSLFMKPSTLSEFCSRNGLTIRELHGVDPDWKILPIIKLICTRSVPKDFSFRLTRNLLISYCGCAEKTG